MTENQKPQDDQNKDLVETDNNNNQNAEMLNAQNSSADSATPITNEKVEDRQDIEEKTAIYETATPADNKDEKKRKRKIKDEGKVASFRVSQALYKTILTNLQVILVVFMVGLIGWLVWYLSPLTSANSTYNAEANENAVSLVVDNLAIADAVSQANNQNTTTNLSSSVNATTAKSCDLTQPKNQQRYQDSINRVNQSLTTLFQQKRLANHYQLQTANLWQQACDQNINEDSLAFALKTLASPDRLLQLQWREQQPNRRNQNDPNVAHMPTNWLTQTNPWYGLPGCVYIKTAKTADNQTGYLYVDNRVNSINNGETDPLTQLCNNPRLIPMSVKSLTGAVNLPNANAINNPAINGTPVASSVTQSVNDIQNQANNVLQTLQDKPTQDPKKRIESTNETNATLPRNLGLMYSELSNIHSTHFDRQLLDAYESYQQRNDKRNWWQKLTAPPMNSINIDGSDIKIGYNMALTLDPAVQNTAQQVADCVTNSPNATVDCGSVLSPALQNVANGMYENALVRSVGIAVIDVKTQGVLALASSDSNCYRADNGDTTIKPTGCPTLWKKDWSKQNLLNHALYQTVYPGSIVKTVQALGLVRANPRFKNMQNDETRYLKQVMASSSTEKVANFLYCQKTTSAMALGRDGQGVCRGMPAFKKASDDMGWSVNCKDGSVNCGFKDLLFGKPYNSEPMLQSRYFSGVLLTDGKQDYTDKQLQFSANAVASCVRGNGGRMNGACRQGDDLLNASMNQVFGAGNAKTSVLGASDMFANLLIADNGANQRRGVHLIEDLWGVNQIPLRPKAWRGDDNSIARPANQLGEMPLNISQSDARATLNLLSGTLLAGTGLGGGNGTAFSACNQAIGSCAWTNGVMVGKTGTPGFNYPTSQNGRSFYTPSVTVNMVANLCNNADIRDGRKQPSTACYSRPYKWFVYGLKDKNGKWDKAVAVLVERNWTKSGLIDDPRDGINRAVQVGVILAKEMYQGSSLDTLQPVKSDSTSNSATVTAQSAKTRQPNKNKG